MTREFGLLRRPWAFGSAVVGFAMLAVYVTLTVGQGGVSFLQLLPWALLMAIAAIAAVASALIEDRRAARKAMVAAAVLFALLGAVSILSIGFGFLVAAALAGMAATRLSDTTKVGGWRGGWR